MQIVSKPHTPQTFELIRNQGAAMCDVCAKPPVEFVRIKCLCLGRVIYVEICESCADEARESFEVTELF